MTDSKIRHRGGAGNFAEDRVRAAEAGRKGGRQSGGNFAHDRARAAAAGRKGGHASREAHAKT
jgi:hypothetical protein